MFENLTDRLSQTLRNVTGKAKLTEDNIKDTLREVRMALLEADVALPGLTSTSMMATSLKSPMSGTLT